MEKIEEKRRSIEDNQYALKKDEKMNCPFCKGKLDILTEEDDMMIHQRLCYCRNCETPLTIGTGPQVKEWYEETK